MAGLPTALRRGLRISRQTSLLPSTCFGNRRFSSPLPHTARQWAPVPNRALLSVTGSHAAAFLNGIVTVQVPQPGTLEWKSNGRGVYSAFLSAQGRIMYDIFIYPYIPEKMNDPNQIGYLIEFDPRAASENGGIAVAESSAKHPTPPLISMLKRYILRSKVRVQDVSDDWDVWAAWGKDPAFRTWPQDWKWGRSGAVQPVFSSQEQTTGAISWMTDVSMSNGTNQALPWLADRRAPTMGIRVLLPKASKPVGQDDSIVLSPPDTYTSHRIRMGVPEGVEDMLPQESFPMDANMDIMGGIDFRKGCYVGQELTVRTYHTGVLRKRVFPVRLSGGQGSFPPLHSPIQAVWSEAGSSGESRPRPRGTGKLLSCSPDGEALALLRIEHVNAVEQGNLDLLVASEAADNSSPWRISPQWPEWWPSPVDPAGPPSS